MSACPARRSSKLSVNEVVPSRLAHTETSNTSSKRAGALLAADLVDEVVIAHGTEALGSKGRKPVGNDGLEVLAQPERWQVVDERTIGADRLTVHRRIDRFAGSEAA